MDFEGCVTTVLSELRVPYSLKAAQKEALELVCSKKQHTFVVLPTGYGKSDIYGLAPKIIQKLKEEPGAKVFVISPLRVLMTDQETRWRAMGIRCYVLRQQKEMSADTIKEIEEGNWDLLLSPPECLSVTRWRDVLRKHYKNIAVVCFDEVHCLIDWGESFRPQYAQSAQVRGLLTSATVLLMTATATVELQKAIVAKLSMQLEQFKTIALVPNRPNIYLDLSDKKPTSISDLRWYTDILKEQTTDSPKCIIFVKSQNDMLELFEHFVENLGKLYWQGPAGAPGDCLVEMFFAQLDAISQVELPSQFKKSDSKCRCLIATVAFGMGVQIPDVQYIVHWGPPKNMLEYWQEIGRAGRDGRQSKAVMYLPPYSVRKDRMDEPLLAFVAKKDCLRKLALQHLKVGQVTDDDVRNCCGGVDCCRVCADAAKEKPGSTGAGQD